MSVTSKNGAIEATSGVGADSPASIGNKECAFTGGSPSGSRALRPQGVVACSLRSTGHAASRAPSLSGRKHRAAQVNVVLTGPNEAGDDSALCDDDHEDMEVSIVVED